jgi:HAD superfamily hydrolase (TIGR01509 family)
VGGLVRGSLAESSPAVLDWAARAVFFDLDDTLVDSGHLWQDCWRAVAAGYGRPWSAAESAACIGAGHWSVYVAEACGGLAPEDVVTACGSLMAGTVAAGRLRLLPGAAQMVASVASQVPVGLVSARPRRYVDAAIAALGLDVFLSGTVACEDVRPGKPAPGPYLRAARLLAVDPGRCLAVEDSGSGIRSAHAAGLTVIAIPNPVIKPAPHILALATHQARDAHEASDLITQELQLMSQDEYDCSALRGSLGVPVPRNQYIQARLETADDQVAAVPVVG